MYGGLQLGFVVAAVADEGGLVAGAAFAVPAGFAIGLALGAVGRSVAATAGASDDIGGASTTTAGEAIGGTGRARAGMAFDEGLDAGLRRPEANATMVTTIPTATAPLTPITARDG